MVVFTNTVNYTILGPFILLKYKKLELPTLNKYAELVGPLSQTEKSHAPHINWVKGSSSAFFAWWMVLLWFMTGFGNFCSTSFIRLLRYCVFENYKEAKGEKRGQTKRKPLHFYLIKPLLWF